MFPAVKTEGLFLFVTEQYVFEKKCRHIAFTLLAILFLAVW